MSPKQQSVLVIDDNEDIRNLLSLVLEKEGYLVVKGVNGSDGLEKLALVKPDLILLDVMMPGLSGIEVLTAIRNHTDGEINSIPICMITAKSSVDDIDAALDMGATSYIIKPFRPIALAEKVKTLLSGTA